MRKFLLAAFAALSLSVGAFAQESVTRQSAQNPDDVPNMGRAPKEPNGIGRLDLRVADERGNPVQGVRAHLESKRTDGFMCESWNWTDARGVSVLPPLHMGRLTLTLKAKGFQTQKVQVLASDLDKPVRVTLYKK